MNELYNFFDVLVNGSQRENILVDVIEHDDMYKVYADLPGYTKNEINVNFDNGYLTISAKHENGEANIKHNYLIKERNLFNLRKRSVYFGDINEDHIQAKFNDGVLEVTIFLKKPEEKQAKNIVIE